MTAHGDRSPDPIVVPVDESDLCGAPDEQDVIEFRAPGLRRRRWWLAAAAIAVAAAVTVPMIQHDNPQAAPTPRTEAAASPSAVLGPPVDVAAALGQHVTLPPGHGFAADFALGERGLYVLRSDGTLVRVGGRTGTPVALQTMPGPPGPSDSVLVDEAAQRIWTIGHDEPSVVQVTQLGVTPPVTHVVRVPAQVFGAALLDGDLWLATSAGGYLVRPDGSAPTPLPGVAGGLSAIAADPAHDRLIAVSGAWPGRIEQIRDGRVVAVPDPVLSLGKTSVAVTAHGIWIGGFASGGQPRLMRLDPATLRVDGSSRVEVGPGAIVWPGQTVVWVGNGGGSGVYCVDAATGRELASWPDMEGPVVSMHGVAYAFWSGGVIRLNLPAACPG